MIRQLLLICVIFLSVKLVVCQNFLNFNSTPFIGSQLNYDDETRMCCDSQANKYCISNVKVPYYSSNFSISTGASSSPYLFIKYDSTNRIVFYKKIDLPTSGFNKIIYNKNSVYIILSPAPQFSYDNFTSTGSTVNGCFVLQVNPLTGALITNYKIPIYNEATLLNVFITNNHFYFFFSAPVSVANFFPTGSPGKIALVCDMTCIEILRKNLTVDLNKINGLIQLNGAVYLTGRANPSALSMEGIFIKYDTFFNVIRRVAYGNETHSPLILKGNILFSADAGSSFGITAKNKLIVGIMDTNLTVTKETFWGIPYDIPDYLQHRQSRYNSFLSLHTSQDKIIFSFASTFSKDSLVGCGRSGPTSTNFFVYTLDSLLNCKSQITINNGDYYNTDPNVTNCYPSQIDMMSQAAGKQFSTLIKSHNWYYSVSNSPDTAFQVFLNSHSYPIAEMLRGNLDVNNTRCANILSLYVDKWLETFMPGRVRYCVGDTLKLGYKKWGNWFSGTTFRLEACTNPAFPSSGIRLLGTFTDTVNTENMLYTRVVIPNMGGGQFYLRLKSIGPDRISNLADTTVIIYNLPAVNAGPDQTVCFGDSVQLAGANFGAGFYWTGSKPNLLNDSLIINPTFKATDSVYAVLHTVNGNGCFNTDTVRIHVIPEIKLSTTIDSLYPKCMNTNVKLNVGTHYNDSITVSWGDGTDTILKGNNHLLWHTYTSTGTVKLRINAVAGGCADSVLLTNLVRANVRVNKSADTTICFGQSVFLNVNATGADSAFTYLYKVGNTIYSSSNGWFIDKPMQNTLYKAGAVNACMGDTLWDSIRVTVIPPLKINTLFTDTSLCIGNALTLTAGATGGRSSGRVFTVNDGLVSKTMVDSSAVVSPVVTTMYWLHVEDGCTTPNDSVAVVVHVLPKLTHSPLPDLVLCENETLQVQSTPHGGDSLHYSYAWKDVNTGAFLSTLASFAMPVLNSTDIVLQITDNRCATWTDTFTVDVIPDLNRWIAVTPTSGCVPLTVHWQIGALAALKPASYVLVFDAGDGSIPVRKNISTAQAPFDVFYTYTTASDFTARVHLYDRNGSALCNPFVQKIRVFARPKAAFTPVPLRTNIIRPDITFSNQSIASDSYLWSFGDGITQSDNNPSVIHHYTDTGTYTVQLIALTNNGCSDTAYGKVWVMDSFTCFIPNTFSPNADKRNDTFKPVCTNTQYYILTVYNRWGEVVYQSDSQTSFPEWMPGNEPDGVYIYSISAMDRNNEVHTFKGTVMLLR